MTHTAVTTTSSLLGLVPVAAAAGIATKTVRGIGARSRKKVAKKGTRVFDGKTYRAANWHATKAIARKDAEHFRRAGHSARVARTYNVRMKKWGYTVYVN